MAKTLKVLFLCTGNSARSILAEACLNANHKAFVQLSNRINLMLALPIESLERQAPVTKLRAIGTAESSQ